MIRSQYYILAAVISAIVTWSAFEHQGALVSLNGVSGVYIETAAQLASGNGYVNCYFHNEKAVPPGYSVLLAGLMMLGFSLISGVQVLGVISSAIMGWSVASFLGPLVRWPAFAWLGTAAVILNPVS